MVDSVITVAFTNDPVGSPTGGNNGFDPQVYPSLYDPFNPLSYLNVISSCDKWVLEPWRGFDFHVPAITYKNEVVNAAKASLPAKYKEAYDQYLKNWLDYLNSNSNTVTRNYPNPTPDGLSLSITTYGVVSNTGYSGDSPSLTAGLSVSFSPLSNSNGGGGGNGGYSDDTCRLVPWQVFYQGVAQWVKYEGGEVEVTPTGTTRSMPVNYDMGAASVGNVVNTAQEPNTLTKVFIYYDDAEGTAIYPNTYSVRPLLACWDYVQAVCQTLSIYDLARFWYVPDPINYVPIDPARIDGPVPATFPARVQLNAVFLRLAVGFIPASGIKEYKASYQGGIRLDITNFCKFHYDAESNEGGGRLEVEKFNFVDAIHNSLMSSTGIPETYHANITGWNTLEVIDLGVEAYLTVYDEKSRAIPQMVRLTPKINYYVPSIDKGEFIWRKKWYSYSGVDNEHALVVMVNKTKYGHVGQKLVVDYYNWLPYNDLIFVVYHLTHTTNPLFQTPTKAYTIIRVPPLQIKRVTIYKGNIDPNFYGSDYAPWDDETTLQNVFVATPAMSAYTHLMDVTGDTVDSLAAIGNAACKHPYFNSYYAASGYQGGDAFSTVEASEIQITNMASTDINAGVTVSDQLFCPYSGVRLSSCTAKRMNQNLDPDAYEPYANNRRGIFHLFSPETKTFLGVAGSASAATAWISPDLDTVYLNVDDYATGGTRYGNFSFGIMASENPDPDITEWRRNPLGGAVAEFCDSLNKNTTHTVSMLSTVGLVVEQGNGLEHTGLPNHTMIEPGLPWNNNSAGNKAYEISNMVVDTSYPPTVCCFFRGKVVDGWDDNPIEVYIPRLDYSTS